MIKRIVPSSGESLPVVGVGTWQTFDVGESPETRKNLTDVLHTLVEWGGTMVDSSPMYGRSEKVVGDLSSGAGLNKELFMATKVWTTGKEEGIRQMKQSMEYLRRSKLDLMQIHNLVDWRTHLETLRKWKEEGIIRYIGLTHYTDSAHDEMAKIIQSNPVDFMQINYNLADRNAERRLLPLAQDMGIAVIANRPFEEGALLSRTKGKELPTWAGEFDCQSWGQFFLKFILSHPAITCVIPGTAKVTHKIDNLKAGIGKLPDAAQRQKMASILK